MNRATEKQKHIGWQISDENREGPCTVVDEAYKRQVEEATGTLSEGPKKGFYKSHLD
jgi:hypothetical protein